MAEYFAPDVYVEDIPSIPLIVSASSSVGGFMGVTERGSVGVPMLVTSWSDYIRKFAQGMKSPFMVNSDLAYAVYGFFQNGGSRCYVARVAHSSAVPARGSFTDLTTNTPTITAKDQGEWGNSLKVQIKQNVEETSNFDIVVKLSGEEVETLSNLSNEVTSDDYWVDEVNHSSKYLSASDGKLGVTSSDGTFSGGADGITDLVDNDYLQILPNFDIADDMSLFAVPGQTSENLVKGVMAYCENRKDVFYVADCPKASNATSLKEYRKKFVCKSAGLYTPYIKVNDPLSKKGVLRDCPPSGHVMGVIANTVKTKGVHVAPAGTDTNVKGAIDVVTLFNKAELEMLNPLSVNCIVPKTNYGIVIWGVRSLHPDFQKRYVTDVLLNNNIRKSVYSALQPLLFEGGGPDLWKKLYVVAQTYLDGLWRDGVLKGKSASQAYYVKCDEELNPKDKEDQGIVTLEFGYAVKKPAEFIVVRINHNRVLE